MAVSLGDDSLPSTGPICPVCFRDYSDNETNLIPRILQCGHTYCTECLDRLLNMEQDEEDFEQVVLQIRYGGREWTTIRRQPLLSRTFQTNDLKCPTCNAMNFISNRDVYALTKNFALLGCRPSDNSTRLNKKHFCSEHNHEKRVYCKDCRKLVCAYCQLYGIHKDHECAIASDAAQPSVEALKVAVEGIKCDLGDLDTGVKVVRKAVKRLKRNRHQCERGVKGYFNELIHSLENQRDSLLMSVGTWTDEQTYILNAQLESVTAALHNSSVLEKKCDNLIKGDALDALSQQDETISDVRDLQRKIEGLSLQPIINPWMKCNVIEASEDVLTNLLKNCTLSFDTDGLSVEEPKLSDDDEAELDQLSGGVLSSSDRDEDVESHPHNKLSQDGAGAGASASHDTKSKNKLYSQETQLLHWSPLSGGSSISAMTPTLDSSDYNTSWSNSPWRVPSSVPQSLNAPPLNLPASSFPSPPNNSYQQLTDFPTPPTSDPNSMLLNPISTKPKFTNLLHHTRRQNARPRLNSASNSDQDEEDHHIPPLLPGSFLCDLSSSESHHSDEENESFKFKTRFGAAPSSMYGVPNSRFQGRLNRPFSMGETSASPDDDENDEDDKLGGRERIRTTGEIFTLRGDSGSDPVLQNLARHPSCPNHSQEEEDFTYSHHLSLPEYTNQTNEIVIPLRHHYSWTTHIRPTNVPASQSSANNSMHTLQVDVNQTGPASMGVTIDTNMEIKSEASDSDSGNVD